MSKEKERKQKSIEYAAEVEEAKISYANKKAEKQIKNSNNN